MRFRINNKFTRSIWVFFPPIVLALTIFFYFYESYKYDPQILVNDDKPINTVFDQFGVKNIIPSPIAENLKSVICLKNLNDIKINDEIVNLNSLAGSENVKRNIGKMTLNLSLIPEFELTMERGQSGCKTVDTEKLFLSKVTSTVNNSGLVALFSNQNYQDISEGKQIEVPLKQPVISFNNTTLYARMRWDHFIYMLIAFYTAWFGFVLLFREVYKFVRD